MFSRVNRQIVNQLRCFLDSSQTQNRLIIIRGRKDYRLPKAPSKIYIVRQPTLEDPEERQFLLREYAHYRTTMRSIYQLFAKDVQSEDNSGVKAMESDHREKEEHQRLLEINRKWNEDIALMREQRQLARQKEREEKYLEDLERLELEKEQQKLEAGQRIRLVQEAAKDYISEENLDAAIEKALDSVSDYNFAIDLEGNMVKNSENSEMDNKRTNSVNV